LQKFWNEAKPGQKILVASYGSGAGSDAFALKVTDKIGSVTRSPKVKDIINAKTYINYATYAKLDRSTREREVNKMAEKKVAIVGIGQTLHDVHPTRSWRSLLNEAVSKALTDAKITIDDVKAGYISMGSPEQHGQEHIAGMASWEIGMWPKGMIHCEDACASGTAALRAGWFTILSGKADIVLVAGVDKNTDNINAWEAIGSDTDVEWEYTFGIAWGPLMAFLKKLHMQRYGSTDEQWLMYPVVTHEYATKNPNCNQYGKSL